MAEQSLIEKEVERDFAQDTERAVERLANGMDRLGLRVSPDATTSANMALRQDGHQSSSVIDALAVPSQTNLPSEFQAQGKIEGIAANSPNSQPCRVGIEMAFRGMFTQFAGEYKAKILHLANENSNLQSQLQSEIQGRREDRMELQDYDGKFAVVTKQNKELSFMYGWLKKRLAEEIVERVGYEAVLHEIFPESVRAVEELRELLKAKTEENEKYAAENAMLKAVLFEGFVNEEGA